MKSLDFEKVSVEDARKALESAPKEEGPPKTHVRTSSGDAGRSGPVRGMRNNPGTRPRARGVYQARPTEAVAQDSILAGIGNVRQPHSWPFQCRRPRLGLRAREVVGYSFFPLP